MRALVEAIAEGLASSKSIRGSKLLSIALDTTGSSVLPVGEGLEPLDEYYLWAVSVQARPRAMPDGHTKGSIHRAVPSLPLR